jgi:WD40 repeat protein
MNARLFRVIASTCLASASASLSAAAGPATATAPATGLDDLTLVSVLGDPAFRHDATVTKAAILSDGRRMVTSANDGTARLWDLSTGRQLQCYRHAKDYVWDFLLLPGEDKLLTAGAEAKVILWDLKTAQRLAEYPHGKMTFRLALDANATRLAAGDQDGHCILWDLAGKNELARFGPGGGACIYTVLFGPGGNSLIAGSSDSAIRAWSLDSNAESFLKHKDMKLKLAQMLGKKADTADIFTLAPSPDGSQIVVCCEKRGPWLMDANSGRELWKAKDVPSVHCAAWSPDGNGVAFLGGHLLTIVDPATGVTRWKTDVSGGSGYGVSWSPDGNEILCGSDNLLCRFSAGGAAPGKRVYPPPDAPLQDHAVSAALPSPDGTLLYECGSSPGIRVWDRRRREVKETWLAKDEVRGLELSADGSMLAAGAGKSVVILDARTGKEIHRFPRESESGEFALTPDGKMIALSGAPGLSLCQVATGAKVVDLASDSEGYYSTTGIAVSGDMELAVAVNGKIRIMKLPGGELLQELGGRSLPAGGGAFAPRANDSSDSGEQDERLAGCAFVPGDSTCLVAWSNKRIQVWAPPQAEANALTAEEATDLIEQLSGDSFQVREAATKRLAAGGRAILPFLRAAQPKDEEQRARLELVQKEILGSGKLRPAGTLDVKEGGTCSFALHGDGRHWALAHGDVPNREILIGEVGGGALHTLTTLHPASAGTTSTSGTTAAGKSAANTVAFDKAGVLIVGNCNGTVSEYRLQPSSQPAAAEAK